MIELKPCPVCGNNLLSHGKSYSCVTPKVIRYIRRKFKHGVTCVRCGYYRPTIKAWNRRAGEEEQHETD